MEAQSPEAASIWQETTKKLPFFPQKFGYSNFALE
jgi:hypothetical protein